MNLDDMIMISVDDHACEPPDMFAHHTPSDLKSRIPRMVMKDDITFWEFEGLTIPNAALNAVVGRRPEEYGFEPTAFDQIRKGCWDVNARVDDYSVNGVLAGLNFPTWPGVYGQQFLRVKDKKVAFRVIQAYNDWAIDEWAGSHPDRFIPCGLIPLWDPELAAKEIRRIKDKGCNSITFPPNPCIEELPSLHRDYWKPVWEACDSNEVVINLHISDATNAVPSDDSAIDAMIAVMGVSLYNTAVDLVFSPVLKNHKNIKFALSEGGSGWVPHALERMDFIYDRHHAWTGQDFDGKKPSDVFQEHCYTCSVVDHFGIKNRYDVGLEHMMWECDYPHAEATWPKSPEILWESVKHIPAEETDMITYQNAMKLYQFDPFKHRPKEKCTVGALRAEAKHVDTSYIDGTGSIAAERSEGGVVTLRDIRKQIAASAGLKFHAES